MVEPSTVSVGPIPSKLMLESSVVFVPRFRGTGRLQPLASGCVAVERPKGGMRPALVYEDEPLSGFTTAAIITRQAALSNSSRSVATRPPFSW